MKKLILVLGLSLMTGMTFANDVKEDKKEEQKETNETSSGACCTATLYYNGNYYDHQTSCSAELTYDQNCASAGATLLRRNPAAQLALAPK